MKKDGYLYQVHSEEKNGKMYPSAKRHYGGIGFIVSQVCIVLSVILDFIFLHGLSSAVSTLIIADLSLSAALIGLKTVASAIQGNKIAVNQQMVKDEDTNTTSSDEINQEENEN